MADIAVSTAIFADYPESYMGGTSHMAVFTSQSVGYAFFFTGVGANLVYKKTTDSGASWGSEVTVASNADHGPNCPAIWFDKWTPGGTGTKIHIAYVDIDAFEVTYISLDTATDTLGSHIVVKALAAFDFETTLSVSQICVSRGGNIYILYSGDDSGTPVNGFARSVDAGANWTDRTSPIEVLADGPFCELLPGNAADNQDMYLVYGDQSASAITVKTYDDSGNSWGESSAQGGTVVLGTAGLRQVSGAVQHSDGLIVVAINTHIDNAAGDLIVATFDGTNWSTKTNILTDKDDWAIPQVFIDQNTDDWYVAWLGNPDGSSTWTATVSVYYAISTDQGANWGTPVNYDEGTDDDYRCLWAGHSTPGATAGRFGLWWQDDDDNDLWHNAVNSIALDEVAAPGTAGRRDPIGYGMVVPWRR